MVKIHDTIEAFDGKTFSEIILATAADKTSDIRVFNHFNRVWNMDPTKETWALSVKCQYADKAPHIIRNIQDTLFDKYGPEICPFFADDKAVKEWVDVVNSNKNTQDEEDDWFEEEDDIEDLVKKGLMDPSLVGSRSTVGSQLGHRRHKLYQYNRQPRHS
jgi:hypothetical protein